MSQTTTQLPEPPAGFPRYDALPREITLYRDVVRALLHTDRFKHAPTYVELRRVVDDLVRKHYPRFNEAGRRMMPKERTWDNAIDKERHSTPRLITKKTALGDTLCYYEDNPLPEDLGLFNGVPIERGGPATPRRPGYRAAALKALLEVLDEVDRNGVSEVELIRRADAKAKGVADWRRSAILNLLAKYDGEKYHRRLVSNGKLRVPTWFNRDRMEVRA